MYKRQEQFYVEGIDIFKEIGDRGGESDALIGLGTVYNSKGNHDEERKLYTKAVEIKRELGLQIDQFFIDNGY